MAARFRVIAAALLFLVRFTADAQQLQRLHVKSITLTTDTAHPKLEVPFTVTLTIRVAENVAQLQNVFLPSFTGPEELGDVRERSSGRAGTLYRETLRLVAHTRGSIAVGSGYLDAIDARDGKPKRFISNDVHLYVEGGPAGPGTDPRPALAWLALAAMGLFAGLVVIRRVHHRVPQTTDLTLAPVASVARSVTSDFETALAQLALRRDREAVFLVRRALWHIAGASEGQTLRDVLRRPEACDGRLRGLLVTIERAAFVEERRLAAAIDSVLADPDSSLV